LGCITERKRAQAELENLHKQLVVASREAGMAEVATNVLRNVLNSVNISTGKRPFRIPVLGDYIRQRGFVPWLIKRRPYRSRPSSI
jgi:hypothetical protein